MPKNRQAYFLTVDWCGQGRRGVFASARGVGFRKDGGPHTDEEIREILGLFEMVLNPESRLLTFNELAKYNRWHPFEEYSGRYGVVLRADQVVGCCDA